MSLAFWLARTKPLLAPPDTTLTLPDGTVIAGEELRELVADVLRPRRRRRRRKTKAKKPKRSRR